ncbi:MAG: alpha/beta fold hydrolase [Pseudonocardiaceae bacterium]
MTTTRTSPTATFVLVSGLGGTSFGWAPLTRELALQGYRSLALDLPGHGLDAVLPLSYQAPQDLPAFATARSPLADFTLQDYIEHVAVAVRQVARHGPVILVGASMGGAIITGVGNTAPEAVSRLVYITAFCCAGLPSMTAYFQTPEAAGSLLLTIPGLGDPACTGAIRTNPRSADPEFLRSFKAAVAAECTDEQFRAALNYGLQPDESFQATLGEAQADTATWGVIPHTYIRATQDRALPLPLQDRMINEADALTPDNPFDVHSINASHMGILLLHVSEIAHILTHLDTRPLSGPAH